MRSYIQYIHLAYSVSKDVVETELLKNSSGATERTLIVSLASVVVRKVEKGKRMETDGKALI